MAFRTWARLLAVTLGAGALAAAGQLGVAYGLGVLRLTRVLDITTRDQWTAQLAWVAWLAAMSAVIGAVTGGRLGARRQVPSTVGTRLGLALAAATGAAITVPLTMQPARTAQIAGVHPVFVIGICAALGALVGLAAAYAALAQLVARWSLAALGAAVWLLALVSVAPSLAPSDPLPAVRLGVFDAGFLAPAVTQRTALFTMPALALLIGAALGWAARRREMPTLTIALAGLAGPAVLTLSYLIAGPGSGTERYQVVPYWAAMTATGAGVLGSVLAAVIRRGGDDDLDEDAPDEKTADLSLPATGAAPAGAPSTGASPTAVVATAPPVAAPSETPAEPSGTGILDRPTRTPSGGSTAFGAARPDSPGTPSDSPAFDAGRSGFSSFDAPARPATDRIPDQRREDPPKGMFSGGRPAPLGRRSSAVDAFTGRSGEWPLRRKENAAPWSGASAGGPPAESLAGTPTGIAEPPPYVPEPATRPLPPEAIQEPPARPARGRSRLPFGLGRNRTPREQPTSAEVPAPAHLPEIPGVQHRTPGAGLGHAEAEASRRRPDTTRGPADPTGGLADASRRPADTTRGLADTTRRPADTTHRGSDPYRTPADDRTPPGPAKGGAPLVPEPHAISAPLPQPEPITPPLPVTPAPEPTGRRTAKDSKRKKTDDEFVDWVSGLGGE